MVEYWLTGDKNQYFAIYKKDTVYEIKKNCPALWREIIGRSFARYKYIYLSYVEYAEKVNY